MRRTTSIALVALLGFSSAASTSPFDERAAYTKSLERDGGWSFFTIPSTANVARHGRGFVDRNQIAEYLAGQTRQRLGQKWVNTALRIARVESGFRCHAQGPRLREGDRAMGLGQVRLRSAQALGYSGTAQGLLDCATGVKYMLAHMSRCIEHGAHDEKTMARCHVGGWGSLRSRLRASAERYASRYQRMVVSAAVPAVPDHSGWLVRGTTSILVASTERGA